MKDHEIAQVVNTLRDLALQYHSHQSLRERIAYVIVPLLRAVQVEPKQSAAPAPAPAQPTKDEL